MPDRTWTILVVEAEPSAQNLIADCLDQDYRVLTAPSGQAALEILTAEESDLVLCDQMLPDMTGVKLFSEIRIPGFAVYGHTNAGWRRQPIE